MRKLGLTDAGIRKLKSPQTGQADHFDAPIPGYTGSLALRITAKGTKSFVAFYRFAGKQRRETLGRYPVMSLADARDAARAIFSCVQDGRDPRLETEKARAQAVRISEYTYALAVDEFIEKHAMAKKQNVRWKDQRGNLLRANPAWHDRPVASIERTEIHQALDACVADGKPVAANRRHAALNTFFRWLHGRDHISDNPMLGVERPYDEKVQQVPVWTDDELSALWRVSDGLDTHPAAYLRLLILLGQRPNEVGGMRWDELDFEDGIWTLPSNRHKAGHKSGRAKTFALPALAIRILKGLPRVLNNPFVFPGRGTRTGDIRPATVGSKLQRRIATLSGLAGFTFQNARRTFRTGLDALEVPPHIKDQCMNHAPRSVGDRHYSKYQYIDEQREAFEAWAAHVGELVSGEPSKVVAFPKA